MPHAFRNSDGKHLVDEYQAKKSPCDYQWETKETAKRWRVREAQAPSNRVNDVLMAGDETLLVVEAARKR